MGKGQVAYRQYIDNCICMIKKDGTDVKEVVNVDDIVL